MNAPTPNTHTACVGVGANLGNRQANIQLAHDQLHTLPQTQLIAFADAIETDPVGGPPDQPPYLNTAALLRTQLSPTQLLAEFRRIETLAGRQRRKRWGPRTLDLDLLLYDQVTLRTDSLTVPHPRMHERRFVLQPLPDIAPDAHHPLLQKTVAQLLEELNDEIPM